MRKIKIAAINLNYVSFPLEANPNCRNFDPAAAEKYINGNIESNLKLLHEAGKSKTDLVCTHEDFKGSCTYMKELDFPELFTSFAEEIPGPTSTILGKIAKQYNMYIAANYYEKYESCIYNTTVLMSKDGEIAGKYRKVHLPPSEKWRVTGGKEFPVFQTDIGRIGFTICYDVIFPEQCRSLALNGADIIVHQTQGWGINCNDVGEALVRTRAAENSVYMIVAKNIQTGDCGKSCIVDNYGNILAEADEFHEGVIAAEFKPDFDLNHEDGYNALFSGVSSLRAELALEREPALYSLITAMKPPLLEKYIGMELQTTPDKAKKVFRKWRKFKNDMENNRPVKMMYHW